MSRSADNLIWIDLEFTNLDPTLGSIMQAAMVVTGPDLTPLPPPGIPEEVGGLLFDVRITEEHVNNATPWVRENQQGQMKRSLQEDALPLAKVEELFVGYLLATCVVPEEKHARPLLAGNSIHGDKRQIAHHMPELDQLVSFRLCDVTTIKELARRWYPDLQFSKNKGTIGKWYPSPIKVEGAAHDALFDIKGSIAELCFYRARLFGKPAKPSS